MKPKHKRCHRKIHSSLVRDGRIASQPNTIDYSERYDFTFKKGNYAPGGKYENATDVVVEDGS